MPRKKITPEVFESFAIMKKAGIAPKKIAEVLAVNVQTVYMMSSTGSYEAYRKWANEHVQKTLIARKEAEKKRQEELERERAEIAKAEEKRHKWGLFNKKKADDAMTVTFKVAVDNGNIELVAPMTAILSKVFDGEVEVKYND